MEGQTEGWREGWVEEWMDGWMEGWMDGWMHALRPPPRPSVRAHPDARSLSTASQRRKANTLHTSSIFKQRTS